MHVEPRNLFGAAPDTQPYDIRAQVMNCDTVIVEGPAMDPSDCGVDDKVIHQFLGGSSIEDRDAVMEAFDDARITFQEDDAHSNQKICELKFPNG